MNDLSDEAMWLYIASYKEQGKGVIPGPTELWQECRRRAQLLIRNLIHDFEEEERKAFEAGFYHRVVLEDEWRHYKENQRSG